MLVLRWRGFPLRLIGTVTFMWFEDVVSAANPFHWLTIVGLLLIAVVLFAPRKRTWRRQTDHRASPGRSQMSAIFEVSGLQKNFGGLVVTNNVSLSLSPGDRTVLIGPNSSARRRRGNLVQQRIKPSAGTVRIAGEDVDGVAPASA